MAPIAVAAKASSGRAGRPKRQAETEGAPLPKRAKAKDPVAEMCGEVEGALKRAAGLSDGARDMLIAMVPGALSTSKDARHKHQDKVACMIGDAIAGIRGGLEEKAAEQKGRLDGLLGERADLEKKKAQADAAAASGAEALAEKQVAQSEQSEKTCAAQASLNLAQKAKSERSKHLQISGEIKARFLTVLSGTYKNVYEGAWSTEAEAKKLAQELVEFGREFSFDVSLLNGLPPAAVHSPSDRGSFDVMILEQYEGLLRKQVETLTLEIADADKMAAELEESIKEAEQACQAGCDEDAACEQAVAAAKVMMDELAAASKVAQKELRDLDRRIKTARADTDAAEAEVEVFEATTQAAFEKLRDRDLAAPPVLEPAAELEAATAAAATEPAAPEPDAAAADSAPALAAA